MNSAFHIDPLSSPDGDVGVTAPDVSPESGNVSFMLRMWMWLSQICSVADWGGSVAFLSKRDARAAGLGESYSFVADDAEVCGPRMFTILHRELNRRERHMMARRERGIRPTSRYAWRGMGGPLRAGASFAELQAWARGHCRTGRFQSRHGKYYMMKIFHRLAMWAARKGGSEPCPGMSGGEICHAPLSPD